MHLSKIGATPSINIYMNARGSKYAETKRQYYLANKDRFKAHRIANMDKIKAVRKAYRKSNADKVGEYGRNYYQEHKEELNAKWKAYYQANKDRISLRNKAFHKSLKDAGESYFAHEYKNNPEFRIAKLLRTRLRNTLLKCKAVKSSRTLSLLGCTLLAFKQHIESQFKDGMSWDNCSEWHLDHILPCSSFDLTIPEQQQKCFHYTNIQPLWAADNLSKSNKLPPSGSR